MKKTNKFAVVACTAGFVSALCTLLFIIVLWNTAVAGLYRLFAGRAFAVVVLYLFCVGFTLLLLLTSAIGILVFTVLKRRKPNRIFLGVSIAAAALNITALLVLLVPMLSSWTSEYGVLLLVFAAIAPSVACASDVIFVGFAIAALRTETRLFRAERVLIDKRQL